MKIATQTPLVPKVSIPFEEYEALKSADERLRALEKVGIYGWPGYESAMRLVIHGKAA